MSGPVLIFLSSSTCGHCNTYKPSWPAASAAVKSAFPNITTLHIETNNGSYDTNKYPAALRSLAQWYPIFLLVPGATWDRAMNAPASTSQLKGVEVLGASYANGRMQPDNNFNYNRTEILVEGVRKALAAPGFREVETSIPMASFQTGSVASPQRTTGFSTTGITPKSAGGNIVLPTGTEVLRQTPSKVNRAALETRQCSPLNIVGASQAPHR